MDDRKTIGADASSVGAKELTSYLVISIVLPAIIVGVALARDGAFTRTSLPAGSNLFRGDFALSSSGTVAISNVGSYAGYNDPRIPGASGLIVRAATRGTTRLGFDNLDGTRIGVTAGQPYKISAVLFDVASPGSPLSLGIEWFDGHGNHIEDDVQPPAPIPAKPTRLARTIPAPNGAASAIPYVEYTSPGANEGFGVGQVEFTQSS